MGALAFGLGLPFIRPTLGEAGPGPDPEGSQWVQVLAIISPDTTSLPELDNPTTEVEVDDATAIKALVEVGQVFATLDALGAVWLGAHATGDAIATPPAAFSAVYAAGVPWGPIGGWVPNIGLPPEVGGLDAYISAVATAATGGDRLVVLGIIDSDVRSRFPDLSVAHPTGYLLEFPHQTILDADEGSVTQRADATSGEPGDQTLVVLGSPCVVIRYTGV